MIQKQKVKIAPQGLRLKGRYSAQLVRGGEVIGEYNFPNGIVDAGLNHILNSEFTGTTQVATWYIGLIDNAGYSALANSDTLLSHAGWAEFTGYSGNRKAWTPGAAAARSMTNAVSVDFSITGNGTLKGLFVGSAATGTTGTLWSTAAFGANVTVANGDVLRITYTVSG